MIQSHEMSSLFLSEKIKVPSAAVNMALTLRVNSDSNYNYIFGLVKVLQPATVAQLDAV